MVFLQNLYQDETFCQPARLFDPARLFNTDLFSTLSRLLGRTPY